MKKIFLLSIIIASFLPLNAQMARYSNSLIFSKNSQATNLQASADGNIENIAVYPNPVVEQLKVSFKSSRRTTAAISIFNNIGKQVYTRESEVELGQNFFTIDVRDSSIEPGIYFVQIVSENEKYTRKLIVK
jgi:hypothetical protein